MVSGLPGIAYRLAKGERWQIVEIGDQVFDLIGYTVSEFLQRKITFFELTHPEDADYVREKVNASLEADGQFSVEYRIYTRSGEIRYLWERGQGVFDDAGQLLEIVGFAFDSTEHQQQLQKNKGFQELLIDLACSEALRLGDVNSFARECLQPVADLLEASRVSLWRLSESGNEFVLEQLYRRREGDYSSGEVIQISECANYFKHLFSGRCLSVFDAQNDPRTREEQMSGYLGRSSISSLLDVPIRKGSDVVGVFSVEEVGCKRRWTQDEVSLVNELADLVNQTLINQDLHKTEERLLKAEAANAAKKNFLGILSHELRTPLNGVLGIAELLNMTDLDEQQRNYVTTIENSGRHLLQVITAIVDLSHLQDGVLELDEQPCDIRDLLQELIRVTQAVAATKSLTVRLDVAESVPTKILIDNQRLQQIVLGLLSNAIKYTDDGSVELTVSGVVEGDKSSLRLAVADTGPGIDDDIRGDLFNPFVQVRAVRLGESLQGAGLGLSICHELVKLMAGKLTFETHSGVGTTFILDLPLKPVEASVSVTPPEAGKPLDSLKTLVVEDDKVNQLVAAGLLKKFGIEADVCDDGAQAVELLSRSKRGYDLILMDCEMPIMDGFDAARKIRQLPHPHNDTYIAALTAHAMTEYRNKAFDCGMNEFLTKPINQDRLEQLLKSLASP